MQEREIHYSLLSLANAHKYVKIIDPYMGMPYWNKASETKFRHQGSRYSRGPVENYLLGEGFVDDPRTVFHMLDHVQNYWEPPTDEELFRMVWESTSMTDSFGWNSAYNGPHVTQTLIDRDVFIRDASRPLGYSDEVNPEWLATLKLSQEVLHHDLGFPAHNVKLGKFPNARGSHIQLLPSSMKVDLDESWKKEVRKKDYEIDPLYFRLVFEEQEFETEAQFDELMEELENAELTGTPPWTETKGRWRNRGYSEILIAALVIELERRQIKNASDPRSEEEAFQESEQSVSETIPKAEMHELGDDDIVKKLQELAELKEKSLIDEEEFKSAKNKLLE
jgi:hypothetical protein